ncbi:hypothetical protein [Enhygromyxa salina]|uniref:hypothetical protein n=1 Tax=Enhygromyxa salina TaxID=215803 RepID=UPI001C630D3F|nr:hypothetical protein [Enhygromyxa salina]
MSANGTRNAYDLALGQLDDGNFGLEAKMKLQWYFLDGPAGYWKPDEKQTFVDDWEREVRAAWDGQLVMTLADGRTVTLKLDFEQQIGGFMSDHWEMSVRYRGMKEGDVVGSAVTPGMGNVKLDNLDVMMRTDISQVPAAHEFGHMLGLDDEYPDDSPHKADGASIMNSGMGVRPRHMEHFAEWAEKHIPGQIFTGLKKWLGGL